MLSSQPSPAELRLTSMSGPTAVSWLLTPPGPLTLGRRADHPMELPDRLVSRDHARFTFRPVGTDAASSAGEWTLTDLDSKHGTWINGRRLLPGAPMPIRAGDFIVIAPWTLRVESPGDGQPLSTQTIVTIDDARAQDATILPLQSRGTGALAQQRLALLLRCAESLHAVTSEAELADVVLDAAVAGTGFTNAAILHPMSDDGSINITGHRGTVFHAGSRPAISRSLIRQAGMGEPARLSRQGDSAPTTQSMVDLAIDEALCVPVRLESSVVSLLYLDDRSPRVGSTRRTADAGDFAIGLARLAGLALANLRRLDVERRQARVEAELRAAAEVQRWVMPRREMRVGPFRCVGESRPGQYVGGDFFDLIPLEDGRLAVALGDVSGKGVAASVLMTVAQGFLHAALRRSGDPAQAVTELNRYLRPRCPAGRFLTLWAGVFDPAGQTLICVDAGHGYAYMEVPDKPSAPLKIGRCDLVGIAEDSAYQGASVPLPKAGRLIVVSDGFIEQTSAEPETQPFRPADAPTDEPRLFGPEGLQECLARLDAGSDPVAALFDGLHRHAGSSALNDDATAVVVEWA